MNMKTLINIPILVHTGLLNFILKLKLFTLTVLELNMSLKKLKNLLSIKKQKQTYLEYNQTIQ